MLTRFSLCRLPSTVRGSHLYAYVHTGKAESRYTTKFLHNHPTNQCSISLSTEKVAVGRIGIGSPYFWSKENVRINECKEMLQNRFTNFLQASYNPFQASDRKQISIEACILTELMDEGNAKREEIVTSVLLEDDYLRPSSPANTDVASLQSYDNALWKAMGELSIDTLDIAIVRIPELPEFDKSAAKWLLRASEMLERHCAEKRIQSYGFALPKNAMLRTNALQSLLFVLDTTRHCKALQLPICIPDVSPSITSMLFEIKNQFGVTVIGEHPLLTNKSDGKPFSFQKYAEFSGEQVASCLSSAFNMAIGLEKHFMDNLSNSSVTIKDQVVLAHALAHKHKEFDNFVEWIYVRETALYPQFEFILKELSAVEKTKKFAFGYSIAMRELFKCFTASIEFMTAEQCKEMTRQFASQSLLLSDPTNGALQRTMLKAAHSSGADVILIQNQIPNLETIAQSNDFSQSELKSLQSILRPLL